MPSGLASTARVTKDRGMLLRLVVVFISVLALEGCKQPVRTETHGPVTLKKYQEGGGLSGRITNWWIVEVNGNLVATPDAQTRFAAVDTSPRQAPVVVLTASKEPGGYAYYLLNAEAELRVEPIELKACSGDLQTPACWSGDGRVIVGRDAFIDVGTGKRTAYESFTGTFLSLSPDRRRLASFSKKEDGFWLRVQDLVDGRVQEQRANGCAWIADVPSVKLPSDPRIRWIRKDDEHNLAVDDCLSSP